MYDSHVLVLGGILALLHDGRLLYHYSGGCGLSRDRIGTGNGDGDCAWWYVV